MRPRLHSYFRSSTSVRVRVALALKGVAYDYVPWNLRTLEHQSAAYRSVNPQALVPALEMDGLVLTQSLAIMEYLDERFPDPPLLPRDAAGRARVRAIAAMIGCDIHPLNNLRVLRQLEERFGANAAAQAEWFRHWVAQCFPALEQMLGETAAAGRFCHGDTPGLADICLYAQVINNRRFDIAPDRWPRIAQIFAACAALPAFAAAAPDRQPDAVA